MNNAVQLASDTKSRGKNISIKGLNKSYETATGELPVLAGIDLEIKDGEFVALVGPSGCGKSTLLKIIAGLTPFNGGSVAVAGDAPREGRRDIGVMLQQAVLMPWLNVRQNVTLPFKIARVSGPSVNERVDMLIDLVGLSSSASMNTWELSGGMQQRVALARALALDPSVMLMDEPFSALDEFKREHLNVEVASMADNMGKTTILVTHSIPEAVLMADRVITLGVRPGRIVGDIPVDIERPRRAEAVGSTRFQEISNQVRSALALGAEGVTA